MPLRWNPGALAKQVPSPIVLFPGFQLLDEVSASIAQPARISSGDEYPPLPTSIAEGQSLPFREESEPTTLKKVELGRMSEDGRKINLGLLSARS